MRCNILQHTATHCNILQHTSTHCNTLQHNALCIMMHVASTLPHLAASCLAVAARRLMLPPQPSPPAPKSVCVRDRDPACILTLQYQASCYKCVCVRERQRDSACISLHRALPCSTMPHVAFPAHICSTEVCVCVRERDSACISLHRVLPCSTMGYRSLLQKSPIKEAIFCKRDL